MLLLLAGVTAVSVGCKKFEVPLTTPEPIKIDPIDITIRVDVFQHGEGGAGEGERIQTVEDANQRIEARTGEVQKLKDRRLVGENHRGLLTIRQVPKDAVDAENVRRVVGEENGDRTVLMRDSARSREVQLHDIQKTWAEDKRRSTIPGEWIEVESDKPGEFVWQEKKSG